MFMIANIVLLAAAGAWVGAIVFQSAIVAPSVFTVLDESSARGFLRSLFPRFFRLGLVLGGLSLLAALAAGTTASWQDGTVAVATLAAAIALMAWLALAMIPAINAARDEGDAGQKRFTALHRLSVLLTLSMLMAGLAIIGIAGARVAT